MSTGIGALLGKIGLGATGAGLEGDIAALLTSSTPEGWLAKGALAAVGGMTASSTIKGFTQFLGGKKKTKRSRSRSKSSRSIKRRRSTKRKGHYNSRKWMAHIRRMRHKK